MGASTHRPLTLSSGNEQLCLWIRVQYGGLEVLMRKGVLMGDLVEEDGVWVRWLVVKSGEVGCGPRPMTADV